MKRDSQVSSKKNFDLEGRSEVRGSVIINHHCQLDTHSCLGRKPSRPGIASAATLKDQMLKHPPPIVSVQPKKSYIDMFTGKSRCVHLKSINQLFSEEAVSTKVL